MDAGPVVAAAPAVDTDHTLLPEQRDAGSPSTAVGSRRRHAAPVDPVPATSTWASGRPTVRPQTANRDQMSRIAQIERKTSESHVVVEIDLDGTGQVDINTGVRFYDHMLTAFGVHGAFDMTVQAKGDVDIDAHHTVEDVAIVLGQAIRQALGDKAGIRRFGDSFIPMDETLAHAAVDVSGRPFSVHVGEPDSAISAVVGGNYPVVLNRHVFDSLAFHAQIALHVRVIHGRDPHHICEAQFKAVARALRQAVEPDPRISGIPSTKGVL